MPLKDSRERVFFLLALMSPLIYALYTGHLWEDFFIMFRHSKNFSEGNGLTFNLDGGRVHGFTSPIATLLLSLFYTITGKTSYLPALWCFRIVSSVMFASAAILLLRLAKRHTVHSLAPILLFLFFILDIKGLAFSSNGMETAFMLFFLAYSMHNLTEDTSKKIVPGGVSFAGLMWTRPDGCLYIAALGLTSLLFTQNKKEKVTDLFKMCLICTALYLPWFLWATWYFGSPIPQPVHAKSAVFDLTMIATGKIFPALLERAETVFYPIYSLFGGWPWWMEYVIRPQALFCLLFWILPLKNKVARQTSLCFLLLCFYLTGIYPYPWYLPAVAVFAWTTLALGLDSIHEWLRFKFGKLACIPILAFVALISFNILFLGKEAAQSIKIQQSEIENKNRTEIGLWLKENMRANETAYTECAGYVAYFSDRAVYDFPGLVTPRVSILRKANQLGMLEIVPELNPDWLVLRAAPANQSTLGEFINTHYQIKKTFDATKQLDALSPFPGRGYADLDSVFSIYHRESKQP